MYWVELVVNGRPVDRSAVMTDGAFEFRSVPTGEYDLRVTNLYGDIILRQFISFHDHTDWLVVELPQPAVGIRAGRESLTYPAGTISVRRLRQQVPSKARNELFRAQKDFEKGEIGSSIKHLQKAIDTFPEYMEAHNNLGVRYMRLGDFERAIAAFQKAAELDPDAVLANTNLALAFISLRRYDEAEPRARRALAADPSYVQARYALGLIAVGRNQCTAEAVENVKGAVGQYPRARLAIARLLACRGDAHQAAAQLRAYLDLNGVENRPAVEAWLHQLEK